MSLLFLFFLDITSLHKKTVVQSRRADVHGGNEKPQHTDCRCYASYLLVDVGWFSLVGQKGRPHPTSGIGIAGPLPGEALSKLQNLTALRIHRNNFSGQVPAAIFEAPSFPDSSSFRYLF